IRHFHVTGVQTCALPISICFAAGLFYRFSSLLMFVSFTYVFLLERTLYNNHYYLMSLLALLSLFIPLQQRWSLDAWWTPEIASSDRKSVGEGCEGTIAGS